MAKIASRSFGDTFNTPASRFFLAIAVVVVASIILVPVLWGLTYWRRKSRREGNLREEVPAHNLDSF